MQFALQPPVFPELIQSPRHNAPHCEEMDVAGMLTRLMAVLVVFFVFSVLAAWAWDRSEAQQPQAAGTPSSLATEGPSAAAMSAGAQPR